MAFWKSTVPTLHQYDVHDVNFLTGFANVLAEAVALAQKNEVMQALLERQKLLAAELQHRVRNNLHLVVGMLDNYARSASDGASRQGIASISRHVVTLTHIYDSLLGLGLSSTIDLSEYLQELCSSLPKLQDGRTGNVDLVCHAESIMLPLDSVTALGMAVAELVTNGYRHAFPDDREGTIVVTLASADVGNAILMIQDDGVGFDTTAATSRRGPRPGSTTGRADRRDGERAIRSGHAMDAGISSVVGFDRRLQSCRIATWHGQVWGREAQ